MRTTAAGRDVFTWANALTGVRLVSAPALVAALLGGRSVVAGAVFALAVVSDLLDGRLARRRGEASALGGLFDHLTDATFASAGLAALAWSGAVPWPLPPLVALAFAQYVADSQVASGRPLRTSRLGRWNGIAYYVLLGVPVVRDALGLAWPGVGLVRALGWALVASTLVSMGERALAFVRQRR